MNNKLLFPQQQSSPNAETVPTRTARRFDADRKKFIDQDLSISEILKTHAVEEDDREALYQLDLLQKFRERLHLNASLSLLLNPIFYFYLSYLAPASSEQIRPIFGLMAATSILYLLLAPRIYQVFFVKTLIAGGYLFLSLGASLITAIISQNQFDIAAMSGIQLALLAMHSQLLLSVVLLPVTLRNALVLTLIVTASLVWALLWSTPYTDNSIQISQLFMLSATAVFVLYEVYFQAVLRREAFDAAFDMGRSAAQLQAVSIRDTVTGGFNRLYLEHKLPHDIRRAAHFSRPLSLIMFDLDNFKHVNDTLGHLQGDRLLLQISQVAATVLRDIDTLARYGGDEFVIVLPELAHTAALEVACTLQKRANEKIQEMKILQSSEIAITLSIGVITLVPSPDLTVAKLISLADEQLYRAKEEGKNRIVCREL